MNIGMVATTRMAIQPSTDASAATTTQPNPRGSELAAFLRKHRAAIDPEIAGFPRGGRRRTPGLRREELAMLADVSATWYTWLEQGRAINVSPAVLARIAAVLRLDAAEVDYLASLTTRSTAVGRPPSRLDPTIAALIERFASIPTLVYDEHWDVVGANAMARALLGYPLRNDPRRDNIMWRVFLDESKRASYRDWPAEARRCVAQFRRSYGRFPGDQRFVELLAQLRTGSPEFSAWWDDMDVSERAAEIGAVTLRSHPVVGDYTMRQVTLSVAGDDLLRINAPMPADDETARKLAAFYSTLEGLR
jgi:transcriptional regulator with XRE-family HTH domain